MSDVRRSRISILSASLDHHRASAETCDFETFDQSDEAKLARGVWKPECFSGWVVWRQQCSEMYDGSNALQKHIQTIKVGCKQKSGVVGRQKCFWGCMEA